MLIQISHCNNKLKGILFAVSLRYPLHLKFVYMILLTEWHLKAIFLFLCLNQPHYQNFIKNWTTNCNWMVSFIKIIHCNHILYTHKIISQNIKIYLSEAIDRTVKKITLLYNDNDPWYILKIILPMIVPSTYLKVLLSATKWLLLHGQTYQ